MMWLLVRPSLQCVPGGLCFKVIDKNEVFIKIQLRPSPPQTGPFDPLVWTLQISCVSWLRPPYLERGGKFRLNWAPALCWSTWHWVLFSSLGKVSWERSAIWPDLYCSLAKLFSSLLTFSPVVVFFSCLLVRLSIRGKVHGKRRGRSPISLSLSWCHRSPQKLSVNQLCLAFPFTNDTKTPSLVLSLYPCSV